MSTREVEAGQLFDLGLEALFTLASCQGVVPIWFEFKVSRGIEPWLHCSGVRVMELLETVRVDLFI